MSSSRRGSGGKSRASSSLFVCSRSKEPQDGLALALGRLRARSLGSKRRRQARCAAARKLALQWAHSALATALLPFACAGCCGAT